MKDRDAYVEKMKAKLDQWNAEINVMEAKARQLQAEKKTEYEEQIASLKRNRNELQGRIKEISRASEGAWLEIKTAADQAWEALRDGINNARKHFD